MKRLAIIPTDPLSHYINLGFSENWFKGYFNPTGYFDEVYVFSPRETDNPDLFGIKVFKTAPEELPSRLREFNIDVLRAYGGMWPCTMACENKVPGIPVIVSIHDTKPEIFYDSVRKADIIFCAQQLESFVGTKFKSKKGIWILPNSIDFNVMHPISGKDATDIGLKYGIQTKYKILQVGRRSEQKNLETLIRALKKLGNDYSLLSAGKGDVAPYQQIADQEGVSDRIVFLESIKNEEMPHHFSWADCLCHPTRWEGMSMLIIEALASAAVIVTSDIPEMKGLILHGQNGLLVKDYENPQALADMVRKACTDQKLRNILQKNARQSVEQFEEGKIQQLEASYYDKILKLKETQGFKTPFWKEWCWDIEDRIKNTSQQSVKNFIKQRIIKRCLSLTKIKKI